MTAVATETGAYFIALPDGVLYSAIAKFYRLRTLEYQSNGKWYAISKYSLQDNYKRSGSPVYRFKGSYLYIIFPESGSYSSLRAWYYPEPASYSVSGGSTDINTPPQLEVEILAYQIAIDIKRKQSSDYSQLVERRNELWDRYTKALSRRDDWGLQTIANVYKTTQGWV